MLDPDAEDVVDADVCFSASSLDLQGECEGDNDDSKDKKGDKGSKHSKHSKECKACEDNEGRKGRTIPHKKGQVDASLDGQEIEMGYSCGTSWR